MTAVSVFKSNSFICIYRNAMAVISVLLKIKNSMPVNICESIRLLVNIATIVLLGMLIVVLVSFVGMRNRLREVELQQRLMTGELSALLTSVIDARAASKGIASSSCSDSANMTRIWSELKSMQSTIGIYEQMRIESKTDYALENAGARVLSIRNTKAIITHPGAVGVLKYLLGNHDLPRLRNDPHKVLQPSILPGECFAFAGEGEITIRLVRSVRVESVCIEHILESMSADRDVSNAPRDFAVYGLKDQFGSPKLIGRFRFAAQKRQILQEFLIEGAPRRQSFGIVRFVFHSNHGNEDNTCVYRIRVHGSLPSSKSDKFQ